LRLAHPFDDGWGALPLTLIQERILFRRRQRGDRRVMRETQNFPPAGNLERPAAALPQV
jgi:hypothetical protein